MRIPAAMAALGTSVFMLASGVAQGSPQGYWHTFQSDRYNIHQLDIANVRHYDGRVVYPVRHIIGGRHEALFVIVGDCARNKRREIFNSSLSRGPYIVDPVQVAELELNDVVDGSNADMDLRAACNWANSGRQDTPLTTRIAAFMSASGSTQEHAKPLNRPVDNPRPVYPEESRRRGEEGTVILKAFVRKEGTAFPVLVQQSSGYEQLDKAALAAVEQWMFNPATKDGRPVEDWYIIPISFRQN